MLPSAAGGALLRLPLLRALCFAAALLRKRNSFVRCIKAYIRVTQAQEKEYFKLVLLVLMPPSEELLTSSLSERCQARRSILAPLCALELLGAFEASLDKNSFLAQVQESQVLGLPAFLELAVCNLLLFIKSTGYILSVSELLSSHAASTAFHSLPSIRLHNHSITIAWERSNWFQMFLLDQFISEYSAGDPALSEECLMLPVCY